MQPWEMLLEAYGEASPGTIGYHAQVDVEQLPNFPATIERYLAPAQAKDPMRGITATTLDPLRRNSNWIRNGGD